jgi:hypothetical protein
MSWLFSQKGAAGDLEIMTTLTNVTPFVSYKNAAAIIALVPAGFFIAQPITASNS